MKATSGVTIQFAQWRMKGTIKYGERTRCGGLNTKYRFFIEPHRLKSMTTRSPVVGVARGMVVDPLGDGGLQEEVHHWGPDVRVYCFYTLPTLLFACVCG